MRGDHPLGWAAVLLVAVMYVHVVLELAAVVAVVVVVCRLAWPRRWRAPVTVGIHRSRPRQHEASRQPGRR